MVELKKNKIIQDDILSIIAEDLQWEKLSGARVIVTGAGGFLGGYIVRTLLRLHSLGKVKEAVSVIAVVRNIERSRKKLIDLCGNTSLSFVEWDLNTLSTPSLGEFDLVIHCGSQASPKFYGTDPVGTILPNTVGTVALLESLRKQKSPIGFLYVSSSEVYGQVLNQAPLKESDLGLVDPLDPRSCYAEGKRAGETICISYFSQYKLPIWIVRPFHTYGPGLLPNDGRVFADFAYYVHRGEDIVIKSDGLSRRAFCYVSDAISAIFTVLLRGSPGVAYNVANAAGEMSINELAQMLVALYPHKSIRVVHKIPPSTLGYVPSTFSRLVPDTNRLESMGWRHRIDPSTGFRRMIDALR